MIDHFLLFKKILFNRKYQIVVSGKVLKSIVYFILAFFAVLVSCCEINTNDYCNTTNDDLFSKALCVSKTDMKQRKTYCHSPVDSLTAFLNKMTAIKAENPKMPKAQLVQLADSLSRLMFGKSEFRETADSLLITDSYLARNAELSIKAWQESEWYNSVDFEVFCNYVLPYKLTEEVPDHWRDSLYQYHQKLIVRNPVLKNLDSLYQYHLTKTYYSLTSREKLNGIYKSASNYSWLTISGEGECRERCRYTMYHLRAAGAPATYDYIPHWGNSSSAIHAYVGLAHKEKQFDKLLKNNNDPHNLVNDLNAAMTAYKLQEFINEEVPQGMYLQCEKTIPKIYRQTWANQDKMIGVLNGSPKNEVDFNLIKPNMIDVTAQYLNCGEFSLRKKLFDSHSLAYLAIFDINGWIPVAFSEFNILGTAKFENIGKNVVYLPAAKKDEEIIPLGNPFCITSNGEKNEYYSKFDSLINMNLIRKYPLFAYSARHTFPFKGCILQGSDEESFSEFVNLDTIKASPFFELKMDLSGKQRFLYYRLWTEGTHKLYVNKFLFYRIDENNCRKEIKRELIRKGNLLYARIDTVCTIDHLIVWPRNDENYIITGDKYELYYWDGQWVSAGEKEAIGFNLNYNDIPSGTIYWLKCLSGGEEERIFTYENGKQVWW
ncbi:MAG: hypothetical protein JW717_12565 [Marinilabiliaceae bacterium]|nr:hypothetical protein [Marinilabiliaceae bacterium]